MCPKGTQAVGSKAHASKFQRIKQAFTDDLCVLLRVIDSREVLQEPGRHDSDGSRCSGTGPRTPTRTCSSPAVTGIP